MKFYLGQSEYVVSEEDETELVNVRLVGQLTKLEHEELQRVIDKGWGVELELKKE